MQANGMLFAKQASAFAIAETLLLIADSNETPSFDPQ